uniref:Uncharacterized protein n=1 Tax=Noccaea caerulescens TaxID=107243 RepID=A0A1J3JPK5_NOCCA
MINVQGQLVTDTCQLDPSLERSVKKKSNISYFYISSPSFRNQISRSKELNPKHIYMSNDYNFSPPKPLSRFQLSKKTNKKNIIQAKKF